VNSRAAHEALVTGQFPDHLVRGQVPEANALVVAYAGTSDANANITNNAGTGDTELAYNGVRLGNGGNPVVDNPTLVTEGAYTFWGYEHVYYQYCVEVPDRWEVVRYAIRHGVDVESLHVDVCPSLELFGGADLVAIEGRFPGAARAAEAVQLPVYESLSDDEIARVGRTLKRAVSRTTRASLAASRA
jgi:hypothetical protein